MRALLFVTSLWAFAKSASIHDYLRATVCPGNKIPAYYLIQDSAFVYQLGNQAFFDVKEADCLGLCADNKNPDNSARILCGSVTYDERSRNCTLSRFQTMPNGPGDLVEKSRSRYYEKFCLDEDVPAGCGESLFYRHSQATLIGFAYKYDITETMAECVLTCVKEERCKSVMYYPADNQCILNSESAHDHPEFFYEEKQDNVVYIENGCAGDALAAFSIDSEQKSKAMEKQVSMNKEKSPMMEKSMEKSMEKPMDKPESMQKSTEKSMSEVEMMVNGEKVSGWSDWSDCDPDNYTRSRARKCLQASCSSQLVEAEACPHLKGWSAWSQPCQQFSFNVKEKCLGFKVRVCLGDKSTCLGPHYKYCFRC